MNKYFSITISDQSRSKHFSLKTSTTRNLALVGVFSIFVVLGSFAVNLLQHKTINSAEDQKTQLHAELIEFDKLNSDLKQIITRHKSQVEKISAELVEIERFSGVETGDLDISLEERIKLVGQFYNAKEEEYSVIGNRVEQIEDVIGLDGEAKAPSDLDLSSRVELASLTASQEMILHDSIPNGYPLKDEVITSKFGMRKHPVTKINSFHNGVDLRAKVSTEIYATADGFVSHADSSDLSGKRIVLMHNFGFETRYTHLDKVIVSPGDIVHKGDLIGYSGNTGRSSAPHLHYEIRYLGQATDPYEFLKWDFGTHDIFTQVRGIKWPSLISLINKQITHQTLQLSQLDRISQEK